MGTKGRCNLLSYSITGETNWRFDGKRTNMYDLEHAALFDSIRSGQPINNGRYMCLSSALAIMAQMAFDHTHQLFVIQPPRSSHYYPV